MNSLSCLTNLLTTDNVSERHITPAHQKSIVGEVMQFWTSVPIAAVTQHDLLQSLICKIILVTSLLVVQLDNVQTAMVSSQIIIIFMVEIL